MNIITSDRNILPTDESFIIDEFLIPESGTFKDLDISLCIVLLSLDFATKVHKLGIIENDILLKDLFSDNYDVNWTRLETAWANILRNTQRNIKRLLDEKEMLLLKERGLITSDDEKRYDDIDGELIHEVQEAKHLIEETTQRALGILSNSSL